MNTTCKLPSACCLAGVEGFPKPGLHHSNGKFALTTTILTGKEGPPAALSTGAATTPPSLQIRVPTTLQQQRQARAHAGIRWERREAAGTVRSFPSLASPTICGVQAASCLSPDNVSTASVGNEPEQHLEGSPHTPTMRGNRQQHSPCKCSKDCR